MILGIGTDLVDCRRFEKAFKTHQQRLLDRLFTEAEQIHCQRRQNFIPSFAKIYAAKEAIVKAIGNTKGIHWKHIEIKHLPNGKPIVSLVEQAFINYQALIPTNMSGKIDLSLSDEPPYAQAFVVISALTSP